MPASPQIREPDCCIGVTEVVRERYPQHQRNPDRTGRIAGKIKEDLPLEITVGAIENQVFDAVLDYIAPKGVEENGAIQFEIKGTLRKQDTTFIRAGLSANASIILARADSVLALKEALIQFDDDSKEPFVEIEVGDQQFERKEIQLGISDGIYVEVKSGITDEDKIKVWNNVEDEAGR